MALYAVHYAWVDGHAAKAPVGIWGEGGVSYYPSETEHLRNSEPTGEPAKAMGWSNWVEMRTEWGSTYGASWNGVETNAAMESVLTQLRDGFFSLEHPVKKFVQTPEVAAASMEDHPVTVDDEDGPADTDPHDPNPLRDDEPAARFVIAQSWWLASEIVRRNPALLIHETHPGDGMYDVLAVVPSSERKGACVMLNRAGTLQVHRPETRDAPFTAEVIGSWKNVLATENPHTAVKRLEQSAGLKVVSAAPPSTPRTLAYRFIAATLNAALNDRHSWDVRNEFNDSPSYSSKPYEGEGYLKSFPSAMADIAMASRNASPPERASLFWAVLRAGEPVAIVGANGHVHRKDHRWDLAQLYVEKDRRMTRVVTEVMGDLLP